MDNAVILVGVVGILSALLLDVIVLESLPLYLAILLAIYIFIKLLWYVFFPSSPFLTYKYIRWLKEHIALALWVVLVVIVCQMFKISDRVLAVMPDIFNLADKLPILQWITS